MISLWNEDLESNWVLIKFCSIAGSLEKAKGKNSGICTVALI